MPLFLLGLLVALGGALLLAAGSELQSQAVYTSGGLWQMFLKNPKWLFGLLLLGIAISTNFIALALAPVSAIQSMSIIALAASTIYGVIRKRIVFTRGVGIAVTACLVGILGFIATIAMNPGKASHVDLDNQFVIVIIIQASVAAVGAIIAVAQRGKSGRTVGLLGLIIGAAGFGTITTVFKVMVGLVLRDGFFEVVLQPLTIIALILLAGGGMVSTIHLQLAHKVLPAPTVVAGLTTVDTITAAMIGTLILKESLLTPSGAFLLIFFGLTAISGVIGLRNLRRQDQLDDLKPSPKPALLQHETRNQ
jgi:hypothetical protein